MLRWPKQEFLPSMPPVDKYGALSVRAITARRCPDSEDSDANFTPTELRSADATSASFPVGEPALVLLRIRTTMSVTCAAQTTGRVGAPARSEVA